jgi:hypothetical protein
MLRRVLVSILVLAILGCGSAWAFAGAGFDAAEHSLAAPHGGDGDHAGTPCDHRCHASAHLLALHQGVPTLVSPETDKPVPTVGLSIAANPLAPPLRPPRT